MGDDKIVEAFLRYMHIAKGASAHTLRAYRIDLKAFFTFLAQKNIEKEGIDKRVIRRYLSMLFDKKVATKTILRKLSSLKSFFRYALREKWTHSNPTEDIESPKKEKKLPLSIGYFEVEHLFSQPDISSYLGLRDRAMMELFYSSGLRLSELAGLNRGDFDKINFEINILGKGKKQRKTPITKTAASWILKYLNHPERKERDPKAIFLNRFGKRITTRSIDRNFAAYLKKSGLCEKITPHTIRHTIATHWLENGMDLKTIQLLLGHSCLATTTIYTHVSPKLKRSTYDKTHPRA